MCKDCSGLNPDIEKKLLEIIEIDKDKKGSAMIILHKVQELIGYIPFEAQKIIAENLNIPMAQIYGIVTFYSRFTLEPVGKYKIGVCLGTACYVKGSDKVLEKIEEILKIKAGQTTDDGKFSIDATRCVGACGLAPVMTVNEDVYGKMEPDKVSEILAKYH
jgi:NADH-quinone oxidoreductase, E subunit